MDTPTKEASNSFLKHRLTGPAVHVYKEGRLYIKTSFLRPRRPCGVHLRGTSVEIFDSDDTKGRTYDLENAKLLTQKQHRRFIIHLANKEKLSLFAQDDHDYDEWLQTLSDSIHWRIQRFYEFGEVLGRGAFATVVKGWFRPTNDVVAIKVISKKLCSEDDLKYMQREIDIAQTLHHPNVVRTTDLFESDNTLYIVLEYMGGGTLSEFRNLHGNPSEPLAKGIMRDIFKGIQYIHDKGVVHRDIKPENMLCSDLVQPISVKILDFGLARSFSTSAPHAGVPDAHAGLGPEGLMTTPVGTPCFAAPEVLRNHPYGKEVDLFACGVVMYWLLCGYLPFDQTDPELLVECIKETKYDFPDKDWADASPHAKNMITGLLDRSPYARLTAAQALSHPWLTGVGEDTRIVADATEAVLQKKMMGDVIVVRKNKELRISTPDVQGDDAMMPLLTTPVTPPVRKEFS